MIDLNLLQKRINKLLRTETRHTLRKWFKKKHKKKVIHKSKSHFTNMKPTITLITILNAVAVSGQTTFADLRCA